ncbi:interferon-induced protein 44-like [Astyanax mexicanus]|uniref:Interferon-induced protein 44-like n=1 Tax=Astyanax mexicanus TaxID=7994 RepID=A0A8T2LPA7_ASTMX|nr:interferon-induced protein 44-like [Astyanax mexicanus]
MISYLKTLRISREDVSELRFLLHGPVGAGKSSIINTVKSIFEGHQFINCLAAAEVPKAFTVKLKKYSLGTVPFVMHDVRGLEVGDTKGVHTKDIINALKGHIADNYAFNPVDPIFTTNRYYIHNPTLNDRMHCLVSVIPADRISMMEDEVIQKMKEIKAAASTLGIPQVLFMTRVDQTCRLTQQDMGKIYQSKKIKDKMMECSNRLGFPLNCIFPVKNYSEEIKSDEKLNCLMLEAFTQIVHSANDFVKKNSNEKKTVE